VERRGALIPVGLGVAARSWGLPIAPLIVVAVGIAIIRLVIIAGAIRVRRAVESEAEATASTIPVITTPTAPAATVVASTA